MKMSKLLTTLAITVFSTVPLTAFGGRDDSRSSLHSGLSSPDGVWAPIPLNFEANENQPLLR